MTLRHKTRFNTSGQDFKTLPRSVKTSFMTKGHGQGVLKRKNY